MKRALVISALPTLLVGFAFLAVTTGGGTVQGETTPASTPTHSPSVFHLEVDANARNGSAPCDPVDTAAEALGNHEIAVCVEGAPSGLWIFLLQVHYDDTLNQAPEESCVDSSCLDDNPDANAGVTLGSRAPTVPDLGSSLCVFPLSIDEPRGDTDPATGPGHGVTFLECVISSIPVDSEPWPLAVITFNVLADGVDTMSLSAIFGTRDLTTEFLCNMASQAPGATNHVQIPCYGAQIEKRCDGPCPTLTPIPTLTPMPTPTPAPGVGGTVRLPPAAIAAESGAPAGGSGWSAGAYAALGGMAVVIAVGGWYARRRWLR